jgi:hypothetical protein
VRREAAANVLAEINKHAHELTAILTAEHGRLLTSSQWEIAGLTQFFLPGFLKLRLEDEISP